MSKRVFSIINCANYFLDIFNVSKFSSFKQKLDTSSYFLDKLLVILQIGYNLFSENEEIEV